MKTFVHASLRCAFALALTAGLAPLAIGAEPPSDAEKLKWILAGREEIPRARRIKDYEPDGVIDAVGRLVSVGDKVYFKTADQSYIPKGRWFPYPELFFELHLTETYAYKPLMQQGIILKGNGIGYDGPLHIKGNWAYDRPYHIFGLVWVDAVSKVAASPEGDWSGYKRPGDAESAGKKGG